MPGSAPFCRGRVGGGFRWTGKAFAPGEWIGCGYQELELLEQMDTQCVSGEWAMKALQLQALEMLLDLSSPGQG